MAQNKFDFAWLAGFMDGDGYYTCAVWERRAKKSNTPSITIAPRIGAAQSETQRLVLDRCKEITGCGHIYLKKELSNKLNSAPQATWIVSKATEIKIVCEIISPYVFLKKSQCEKMLKIVDLRIRESQDLNRRKQQRIPIETTLECAKLGLSLNPHATTGRNSRHNSEKRTWEYWKKRIPQVYREAERIIGKRKAELNLELECTICKEKFHRYRSDIMPGTKNSYCSVACRKVGEKTIRFKERVVVQCTFCGKDIGRAKVSVRPNNWCSKKCQKAYRRKMGLSV